MLIETIKLQKACQMLRFFTGGCYRIIVFTDEKIFTVECAHSHQNDRQILAHGSLDPLVLSTTVGESHFPVSVMVWAGICATGKTPLIFVEKVIKQCETLSRKYSARCTSFMGT